MTRQNIASGGPFEPVFGYSRAVRIGDHIHVSGTCAPATALDRDAKGQAEAALEIIRSALKEAGADFTDVVRTVVYLTDVADKDLVAEAHVAAFGDVRPASTLVAVAALIDPRMVVEIEAYAVLGG